jgi:anti-sigma factor RsiW
MPCKHIQHLIISEGEEQLSAEMFQQVEEHTARCGRCARFRDDLETIRRGVAGMPQPQLSRLINEQTRIRCREEARNRSADPLPLPAGWRRFPIPRLIWASIPILMILTSLVMAFGLQDLLNESGSLTAVTFIALILQNGVMLIFAPILLFARRRKRADFQWESGDAYAV